MPGKDRVSPKRTMAESAKAFAATQLIKYLDRDPEKNIPKLVDFLSKLDVTHALPGAIRTTQEYVLNPESNWYKLVQSFWTDIDPHVRETTFINTAVNAALIGFPKEKQMAEKYNCNVPFAILMDPTSACNLNCIGCWAAEYGNRLSLTFEEMDSIVTQGKELGTYLYLFTGGEPLVRKKDIIRLCEKHDDCMFTAFTNGTLIDEEFADEMLRVGNFAPAISVEGFEEATDGRRGQGTYAKVMRAMEILKRKRLLFGVSCCYTSANVYSIGSEEFFDHMVEMGAKFMWLFTYMPVGNDAVPDLMVSAEQRKFMYEQVRKFRDTKPIFTMDFWNDGEYVGGCIAGGRHYCHINAAGDMEPCAFIHYSDSNIREKTLLECYQAPLFEGYRAHQPFNQNHLRVCPLLDNVGALAEIVDDTGAVSTDMESPEDVHSLTEKIVDVANKWQPVADELWVENRAWKAEQLKRWAEEDAARGRKAAKAGK